MQATSLSQPYQKEHDLRMVYATHHESRLPLWNLDSVPSKKMFLREVDALAAHQDSKLYAGTQLSLVLDITATPSRAAG